MEEKTVNIIFYRWAGQWGPFKIKIPCGECTLTDDIIKNTLQTELAGIPVNLTELNWLDVFWQPLKKGGWHAPIVIVDGHIISQGNALNRGLLIQAVVTAHSKHNTLSGNHLFGKADCPHCRRAKAYLTEKGITFQYHDVIESSRALYEMLSHVKPLIGNKTPVTVPQIWLDGKYIGGADALLAMRQ